MGLLDWFRPGPPGNVTVLPDVIWLSQRAKFDGLARAVSDAFAGPEPPDAVFLVGHFPNTVGELGRLIDDGRISGPAGVFEADDLIGRPTCGLGADQIRLILIVVGERHPLRSRDDALVEFARSQPLRSRLVFHLSLGEPLMRVFVGGMENTLRKLGMGEDEAIESPMVARRIKAAQDKLAGRCRSDFPAESAEEWMAKNGFET